jgi:uncharacterized membrane protein
MRLLLIALLSLGLFFRLAHLDHKLYWYDEAFTSLRAAGYTEAEVVQHFAASDIVSVAELQQFQQPAPDRSIRDTIHSLATEDNQHPPLYYTIAYFWSRWVGSSVADYRLLPALFSLLSLPIVYWLSQELFVRIGRIGGSQSRLPGWVAVGLFAISPFQINYAQESRQYSLWGTTTLLSTAVLLWAIRVQSFRSWAIYALTLVLNFYTFLLAGLVAVAHAIYVICTSGFWTNKGTSSFGKFSSGVQLYCGLVCYGIANLVGVVAFLPWLWVLLNHLSQAQTVTDWTNAKQSLLRLGLTWASIVARVFYDRGETIGDRLVQFGIVVLVGYAFYYLCRYTPRRVWLLVVALTFVPVLPLLLADLALGGIRSTFPRYFVPSLIGIQLAVVYLLSAKLNDGKLWRWIGLGLCCAGVVSSVASFSAPTWWTKTISHENAAVATVINQSTAPLLVSDAETGDLLALSHLLKPEVALLIRPRCYTCRSSLYSSTQSSIHSATARQIQTARQTQAAEPLHSVIAEMRDRPLGHYSELFFFHPRSSKAWRQAFKAQKLTLQPISLDKQKSEVLWRIVNKLDL